jgi:hypothetical protein
MGTPASTIVAGSPYYFQPTLAQGTAAVTFTITNPPTWATFSAGTGALYGVPPLTSLGTSADITIIGSNGAGAGAIGPFDITVTAPPASPSPAGSATLTWAAPTQNTDGTPLNNLAGYHIYYGTSATQLSQEIILNGPATTNYVVNGLTTGTYYFAVTAISSQGTESAQSNLASKTF